MYISNSENLQKDYYSCSCILGEYLVKKGIPLLSRNKEEMVFSKTKELQKVLDNLPFYLRFLLKVGVING